MRFFTECSGPCILCAANGHCLAGHGDDDFWPASDDKLKQRYLDSFKIKDTKERENIQKILKSALGNNVPEVPNNKITKKRG